MRKHFIVGTVAAVALSGGVVGATTASAGAPASCGAELSLAQVASAGRACTLSTGARVSVTPDLEVVVPERGVVASVAALRTTASSKPSAVSVYRSTDDRLAVSVDAGAPQGDPGAVSGLRRISEASTTLAQRETAPTRSALAPAWCGASSNYQLHWGRWSGGLYPWIYNSRTQPNSGARTAIEYGFKFITADSSDCGTNATSARYSYRGTTTRYTWGTRDNGNVVGWAGYGTDILAMSYWWTDVNGRKLEADIGFNNRITNWSTSLSGTVPSGKYDVISVATHEAGHVFGLDHDLHSTQVMYPSIGTGANKRVKRSGDLTGMAVAY